MTEHIPKSSADVETRGPVIVAAAGDIGRTAVRQLILVRGVVPAGIVLTDRRLADEKSRQKTAEQISRNYTPEGEDITLDGVELTSDTLHVGDHEIPAVGVSERADLLSEGHPVIDATGQSKDNPKVLEEMLEEGADFVVATNPIPAKHGIPSGVHGVADYKSQLDAGANEQRFSASSCTTTAVSSLLGPLVVKKELGVVGAFVNVSHARTNSDNLELINNNIKLSGSGAVKEVPRVLGLNGEDEFVFDLKTTRTNVADGSLADVTLLLKPHHGSNLVNAERMIRGAVNQSESASEFDDDVVDTKGVVGRLAASVINLTNLQVKETPNGSAVVLGIHNFYDNVHGYTNRMLASYVDLDARRQEKS